VRLERQHEELRVTVEQARKERRAGARHADDEGGAAERRAHARAASRRGFAQAAPSSGQSFDSRSLCGAK
jgi:hypothetical protein